jgi:Lipase (class 3)
VVSLTDTYSIHSTENRPPSPTAVRTHLKAQSSILRTRSEKDVTITPSSPQISHRGAKSYVPSIYTLKTNNSETSLVLAVPSSKGAFENEESIRAFTRTGSIDSIFPRHHIVRNMARFVRFASASYGASFMRVMGITTASGSPTPRNMEHHSEHHSFSHHTQLPASTILLSSFVDPQGGTNSMGQTNTGVPMVHFVSLDHDSRAVVLTCRGTLGFEDILTDMTCDYDDLVLRGKTYKVHKGIHASALRLLLGNGSRVLATLATALEEFPEYGLVMCGHSLGGGVTALLAIMISEPGDKNSSFVTAASYQHPQHLIGTESNPGTTPQPLVRLPPGRPIHVYAYGPPATISPSLRLATRSLVTTLVNGQDLVPYLSLGVLHDLQAVALAFKTDDTGAKGEVRARAWAGITSGLAGKWYGNRVAAAAGHGTEGDDKWAYAALKALRASMLSTKLVPPGEVFAVETVPVLQRDAFTADCGGRSDGGAGRKGLGRPATRAVLTYVRDVERKFGELQFGGSMLLDHSPGRYEASLATLGRGVLGV